MKTEIFNIKIIQIFSWLGFILLLLSPDIFASGAFHPLEVEPVTQNITLEKPYIQEDLVPVNALTAIDALNAQN